MPREQRVDLAELVLAVGEYQGCAKEGDGAATEQARDRLSELVLKFGVEVMDDKADDKDLPAAVALLLFGDADLELPGGYSTNELSDKSPIKLVKSFPQEFVLLGRATVLLKGIAKRLEVPFSLADKWGPGCLLTAESAQEPSLPLWGKEVVDATGEARVSVDSDEDDEANKLRFKQVSSLLKQWAQQKSGRAAQRVIKKMPSQWRTKLLTKLVERQERKEAAVTAAAKAAMKK